MSIAYLNGEYLPLEKAQVSVMDRGFLFGDGVYEVIPVYGGHLFRLDQHLSRLAHSLGGVRIDCPLTELDWQTILDRLILENGPTDDQSIYLQITRGVQSPRDHGFAQQNHPTIFVMCSPIDTSSIDQVRSQGIAAITLQDTRWQSCHLKTINLLANVLLRQQALDAGAKEAILIRDGYATEGAASNLFLVKDQILTTPPKSPKLLPGVTRDLLLELAGLHGIAYREVELHTEELFEAQEIWLTSSTKEIVPVTLLDGRSVGNGKPGPLLLRMIELFQCYKDGIRSGHRR